MKHIGGLGRGLMGLALGLTVALSASAAMAQGGQDSSDDDDPRGPAAMREEAMTDEGARSRFRVGQTLYREGRFLDAAREFETAYELSPRPMLLFNAYLAYRDAGDLENAVPNLRRYLEEEPDAQNAALLRQRLDSLQERLDAQRAEQAEDQAERERLEAERSAAEEEAERARQEAEAAEAARRAEDENRASPLGYVVGGVGAAMLVSGLVTGVVAKGRVDDLEKACPDNTCPRGFDLGSARSEAQRVVRATDALLIGGGAALIAGVVILLVTGGDSADEPPPPATADFGCDGTGCAMNVTVDF